MAVEPLHIETVVDRVYAALRERIADGTLEAGAWLRQEGLAEELGVSRTPLREALRRLAAEGLVQFRPNRGVQVVDLDEDAVRHAYEARMVVEPGAARLAAARRPPDELAAMRQAIAAQREAAAPAASYAASRAFHLGLVRASGNEHLVRLAESLWVPGIGEVIYGKQRDLDAALVADADEHERIADAIATGDVELAEALVRHHIRAAHARLLEL